MKKINVGYDGNSSSVLCSVLENRFFHYECQREEIHQKFGGSQVYSSNTGLTGSGWVNQHDLIIFGTYRTDAGQGQEISQVHTFDGQPIFGYVPIVSHGGVNTNYPVVLTDGNKVAFIYFYALKETLLNWGELEWKEKWLTYNASSGGMGGERKFYFYNPSHYKGVRATRFLDLRDLRKDADSILIDREDQETLVNQKIGIFKSEDGWFFYRTKDGILGPDWNTSVDPRTTHGQLINGWEANGKGLFWRRKGANGSEVEAFIEIERSQVAEGKYVVEDITKKYIDYEQNFSALEWFSNTPEGEENSAFPTEWQKYFLGKATTKARQDYVYARQGQGINTHRLMEQNPELFICIQDSLDTGNCLPGTETFISKYGIKTTDGGCCLIRDLLKNKSIDEMLKNFSFQKVVHMKLVDPDKEIPVLEKEEEVEASSEAETES